MQYLLLCSSSSDLLYDALNIFLSFPDYVTLLILKSNLIIILGLKPEKFKNVRLRKRVGYPKLNLII